MHRSLVIARTELSAFLRSKTFLIGLLLPPMAVLFASLVSSATQPRRPPPQEFRMGVVDPSENSARPSSKRPRRAMSSRNGKGGGWVLIPEQIARAIGRSTRSDAISKATEID